jgi:hypothetical protein
MATHGCGWAPCFAQAQGNPENPYQVRLSPTCVAISQYNPISPVSPSLISDFETRNLPCPRCGLKDNRRGSELWNSIDGEVSPWPGSTWPVWYLPFLPQQPRVALTPAAVYCQIICVSFFHLPAEGNPRLRTSSILVFQQPHTASGRQASVECIWGPAATADPGSGGLGVDP